jgi:Uma2 family endonuclease
MLTVVKPPRTAMEVFKMLPEGTRCELIENKLYMSPAPSTPHQRLVSTLAGLFFNYQNKSKKGIYIISPIDLFLNSKNAFQPDLVFILNENLEIVREDGIHGAPDLIVEVLSKGTRSFDLGKKKTVYEKSGVKEYWVVDSSTQICTGFRLVGKKLEEFCSEKGKIVSSLLRHTFKI